MKITLYHPAIPQQARAIIRDLVTSPIKITPHDNGTWFEYEAQFAYDWILKGVLGAMRRLFVTRFCRFVGFARRPVRR